MRILNMAISDLECNKLMSKKIALWIISFFCFSLGYSQKLDTFSKSANGDLFKISKMSKGNINPDSHDFITFEIKTVTKKNGKDTVISDTKGDPITVQLKNFPPSSAYFEAFRKMSPGDRCVLLAQSDSMEDISAWVDKHSYITNHIYLLSVESPEVKKKREEEEIRKNLEQPLFNIPQLLPDNAQCSKQDPECAEGVVAGLSESVLYETFEQFKQFSTLIQIIQAKKAGFISMYGLPYSGRSMFQYGYNWGRSSSPPDGTIYIFNGLCTIYPCDAIPGSQIIIHGTGNLCFKLTKDKGLIYLMGKGTVSIKNVVTNLPIVLPKASAPSEKKTPTKLSSRQKNKTTKH